MKPRGDDGRGAVHLAALGPVRTLRNQQIGNETHMLNMHICIYPYLQYIHRHKIALRMYVLWKSGTVTTTTEALAHQGPQSHSCGALATLRVGS